MTLNKLDPNTTNNDIGFYSVTGRRVVKDTLFAQGVATFIQALQEGYVVWRSPRGENNLSYFQAGETRGLVCDMIIAAGKVDGADEITEPTDLLYFNTPANVGEDNSV